MTVGRPITAGRSRDRCVSNVVSNPISDAARAPSPLYRARGQRRPSAASGLPIRNDFGTLSRVDRFQHGESQLSGHDRRCRKQWRIRGYYPFGWRFKRPSATAVDEHAKSLSDEEAWRIGPGAGLLAADAIEKAASMDEARKIFRAFQAQSSRRNVKEVYHAYIERLKREGLGASDEAFDAGRRHRPGGT